jgi:MYND finger
MKITEEVQVFTTCSSSITEEEVKLFAREEELKQMLDSSSHLREWNYRGTSRCDRCGISNSELEGLLIQCAKCKHAYYCSMACFNQDLERHQAFCRTSKLLREPERGLPLFRDLQSSSTTFSFDMSFNNEEVPIEKVEAPGVSKSEIVDDMNKNTEVTDDDDYDDNYDNDVASIAEIESLDDNEDELLYSRRGQSNLNMDSDTNISRNHLDDASIPEAARWEAEKVILEPAETVRREYAWDTPDWVLRSPLKRTELGKMVKERGDLSPIKETKSIPKFEPEWVAKSPLRRPKRTVNICGIA